MDYKQINEALGNLINFRYKNRSKLIEKIVEKEINSEYGEQGESSIFHEVYPFNNEVFIKLTINTDSYGYNEFINGVQFVKPIQKTVTSFEPIG